MKVKLLTSIAGPNWSRRRGWEGDLPKEEAKNLIRTGQAVSLDTETSTRNNKQTTARRRGRPRKEN